APPWGERPRRRPLAPARAVGGRCGATSGGPRQPVRWRDEPLGPSPDKRAIEIPQGMPTWKWRIGARKPLNCKDVEREAGGAEGGRGGGGGGRGGRGGGRGRRGGCPAGGGETGRSQQWRAPARTRPAR